MFKFTQVFAAFVAVALPMAPALAKKEVEAAPVPSGPAAFTDSSAAGLAGTNRVAITSVLIQFQAATNAVDGPSAWFQMFQSKSTSETVLGWPSMSPTLQADFADFAYSKLKADLEAAGFEVVPEAQVKASANYQAIMKQGGIPTISLYGNAMGDAYLVSPSSLPAYLPYTLEGGVFANPKSYIGFVSAFGGKSKTPGGPSLISVGGSWKIPGMEVALAKELNAHVVKATYVVTLGRATAKRKVARRLGTGYDFWGNLGTVQTNTITASGEAYAQPGLMPQQTHISFRTAGGNPKWQKVSLTKIEPPKDGDVSVHLVQGMEGSTDLFSMASSSKQKGGFLASNGSPDFKIMFNASLSNPAGYSEEVGGMIAQANKAMLDLVKH